MSKTLEEYLKEHPGYRPVDDCPKPRIYGILSKTSVESGVSDNDIATDEEVGDVIDDVFGDDNPDVATDEEVDGIITNIFGKL